MFHNNQNIKTLIYKEFQHKLKNIDQIARLAIQSKQKKITEKYGNIQSTAKILKNLIVQFTKKSIKLEQELRQTARIEDLKYQTEYHKKRLSICINLSENLENQISKNRSVLQKYEEQSQKLKNQLILAKTQNIKKILKIQMIEAHNIQKTKQQNKQNRVKNIQEKMNENRTLMKTGLIYNPSNLDSFRKQKKQLTALLWQKINKKITICDSLVENYESLKQKLIKQEKKSNIYGLTGSLLFKLQQNNQLMNNIGLAVGRKNKQDYKLIIYDVLKQRHSTQKKVEKEQQNQIFIDFQKLMSFTPIQILGLIQLKGGIGKLRNTQNKIFSTVKSHSSEISNQSKKLPKTI